MYTKRNFFSQISFFSFLIACLFLILPSLLIAAALTSELATLQSFPWNTTKGLNQKKNCPVKSWTMDPITGVSQIVFVVPKGFKPGT